MSAFLGLAFRDRIEIVSDGAVTDPDGNLVRTKCKFWTSDKFPIAVTGVGGEAQFGAISGLVSDAVRYADDFGQALEWIGRDLPGIGRAADHLGGFSFLIAFWSPTGPHIWKFRNRPDTTDGPTPDMRVVDAGLSYGSGPGLSGEQMQELGITFRNGLRDDGVVILDAMRKIGQPTENGDLQHWIGGHVDLCVIDAGGVRIERLHEWPDETGRPIAP